MLPAASCRRLNTPSEAQTPEEERRNPGAPLIVQDVSLGSENSKYRNWVEVWIMEKEEYVKI